MRTHGHTVAGNEVLVFDGSRRCPHLDAFGPNPGFVNTNIRSNLFGSQTLLKVVEFLTAFMTVSPETYTRRIVPLLVAPDLGGRSGAMFNNKAEAILPSAKSTDPSYAAALMKASEDLVARATTLEGRRAASARTQPPGEGGLDVLIAPDLLEAAVDQLGGNIEPCPDLPQIVQQEG